jgi:hypothetical protein
MRTTKSTRHRFTSIAAAALLAIAASAAAVFVATPASAAVICEQFGTVTSGNFVIMNNRWGSNSPQCINTTASGFSITQQDGTGNLSGAPVSYPAVYIGCHYSNCSPNSPLPAQVSSMGNANTSVSVTYIGSGTWDMAYDIWLNADTNVSGVQDTEIMIWLNHQGSIQPVGSNTGSTVTLAGRSWQVWTGNNGQNNVVSYVSPSAITSLSFNARDFILDTFSRGSQYGNQSWYLTSMQAGFEPWIGGVGLAVNSFSATIGGGGGGQVPGTPGTPTTSNVTANSVTLNWGASSGTVSNYQIERATGASSTSFSQVGTSASTSFTNTGLAASTTYRYRVRATNSTGNSGYSGIVNVTTSSGGGGGGGGGTGTCSVRFDQWAVGYVAYVTVNGPRTGWSIPFTLGANNTIVSSWNANISGTGTSRTATNVGHNGNLAAGQSTQWGFQGSRPSGGPLPTITGCTVT